MRAPTSPVPRRMGGRIRCSGSGRWSFRADLRDALVEQGERKIDRWTASHRLVEVSFPCALVDPFFNANREDDLAEAERLIAEHDNAF